MAIEVMAIEAVMSVEVVPRDCVAAESTVRATAGVPTTEVPTTTAEVPTTTAEMPTTTTAAVSAATAAACIRWRATGEDQDSDQRRQPN
jgi:hypothetical protein